MVVADMSSRPSIRWRHQEACVQAANENKPESHHMNKKRKRIEANRSHVGAKKKAGAPRSRD